MKPLPLALFALLLLAADAAAPADACAVMPPANTPVRVADETAIIVWDAATKTEHFVRKAAFRTEAADFGFLVPTPARPTLAEVNDAAFDRLAALTAPEVVIQKKPAGGCLLGCGAVMDKSAPAVRVLEETTVGGYDAAVLAADDPAALGGWLAARGYPFPPAAREWAAAYLAKKWTITAFKVSRFERPLDTIPLEGVGRLPAVRMSFQTETPFYPYREPVAEATDAKAKRLLRVFLLADRRMDGTLGDGPAAWPGHTVWANALPAAVRDGDLFRLLKLPEAMTKDWHLTEFEDDSSPRPATADVTFRPAESQAPKVREKHVRYSKAPAAPCVMTAALAAVLLAGLARQRSL